MSDSRPLTETSPSEMRQDDPGFAQMIGVVGLAAILFGVVVVAVNGFSKTPRLIGPEFGWVAIVLGSPLLLFHATRETDPMLRWLYGGLGYALVIAAVVLMFFPSRTLFGLPCRAVALACVLPGLALVFALARNETDEGLRMLTHLSLGGLGVLMAGVGIVWTLAQPDFLLGPGLVAIVLGLLVIAAFTSLAGPASSLGYSAAVAVAAVGVALFAFALLRSTVPDLLHMWRNPMPSQYRLATNGGAATLALGLLGVGLWYGVLKKGNDPSTAGLVKGASLLVAGIGLTLLLIGLLRSAAPGTLRSTGWYVDTPSSYFTPTGLLLMVAGLLYAAVGVGIFSDNRLVVMTRRELSAYAYSPIAYLVLLGFTGVACYRFLEFTDFLTLASRNQTPLQEPIVTRYVWDLFPVVSLIFVVPVLTMRLLSEEKRSGTLEVALTAPLTEIEIVLSKFFAALAFFLILWVPWGLLLMALRLETDRAFDYRPLLSFGVGLVCSGAGFVAMGLFFSSLTKNQIVAAVLTFVGMVVLLGIGFIRTDAGAAWMRAAFQQVSFLRLSRETLEGKLWLRDVVYHLSTAAFWLFLTTKVLEARKWS